jgi:hypothetical protein
MFSNGAKIRFGFHGPLSRFLWWHKYDAGCVEPE